MPEIQVNASFSVLFYFFIMQKIIKHEKSQILSMEKKRKKESGTWSVLEKNPRYPLRKTEGNREGYSPKPNCLHPHEGDG